MGITTNAAVPVVILLLAGGAAVPLGAHGFDLLRDDAQAIADAAEASVDRALYDLSRLPLVLDQAYGVTDQGKVTSVTLLLRATDAVAVDDLLLTQDGAVLDWSVTEVLRDNDGSLRHGEANRGDLVRIDVELAQPWEGGDEGRISVHGDTPSEDWTVWVPRNLAPRTVELRVA